MLGDDKGVIVIHEIRVQPRIPVPRWLVRRSLRKDLPDMLACIRGLAKASGDDRRIADDLNRCPGIYPGYSDSVLPDAVHRRVYSLRMAHQKFIKAVARP